MNQIKPKAAYQKPIMDSGLTGADAKLLHSVLIKGEHAVARQKDLIELNKRIVAMFTTLNTGLAEQQAKSTAKDREVLVQKLDEMERAVNGMEGALRIEMAPLLERMLDEALEKRVPKQKLRRFRMLGAILALSAGVIIGVQFSEQIRQYSSQLALQISQKLGEI